MDADITILKALESSATPIVMQYLEVTDCKGRKVVEDESIASIKEALCLPRGLPSTHELECMSGISRMSLDESFSLPMYVVEVITEWSQGSRRILSSLCSHLNFQVRSMSCGTGNGRLECVVYGKATGVFDLLWELVCNMVYSPRPVGRLRMMVQEVADEDAFKIEERLQSLKLMDLTSPCNLSDFSLHIRLGCWKHDSSADLILLHEKGIRANEYFVYDNVFRNYSIVGVSVKYRDGDEFVNRRTEVGEWGRGFGEGGTRKISMILNLFGLRGSCAGNAELIISGSKGTVKTVFAEICGEIAVVVRSHQVYCETT